ncbi:MAG: PEP-CTERM sorting domain-containing protein [Planctomycetaceae bacterium]|jgi:hypothetical protein|nr:PEP-CTERM sorting domain-containing protein [Planctomycetaceae bacterium]
MKDMKNLALILLTGLISSAMSNVVKADLYSDFVSQFGTKSLIYAPNKLTGSGVNLDAYTHVLSKPDATTFATFCVEPTNASLSNGLSYNATLSYDAATHRTANSVNQVLKNGAAWLYTQFATTTTFNSSYNVTTFSNAIQILNGQAVWNSTNIYVQAFLNAGFSQAQAIADYAVGNSVYTGDYSVYVVQLTRNGADSQDLLYVARTPTLSTPEPTTILLWSLGSLGALGISYLKRRRQAMATLAS